MKRRQQFITSEYYESLVEFYDSSEAFWKEQELEEDEPGQANCLRSRNIIVDRFSAIMIRYTAGESIPVLIPYLEKLIGDYEHHQRDLAVYHNDPEVSPLNIGDVLCDYEECLQIISLCVLLRQEELLERFVRLIDRGGYSNADILYEDLVGKVLPDRFDVDDFYYDIYVPLLDSIYAADAREASASLSRYCAGWYSGFEDAQTYWHDTHLSMTDTDGAYFGYWALEAAAIAYLYGIDDGDIDHMVYPKDLVEYARSFVAEQTDKGPSKVYAGQKCTRSGYWFTPAMTDSRRYFNLGEEMPEFKGAPWGATIWYWSGEA